ncbi:MAG: SWIM zinc finger family protein [Saprospiraceae bacterium]
MQFNYKYSGSSGIKSSAKQVGISFAPDTLREPTFFVGQLNKHLPFREAISALHDIVISDLRHQPKDKSAYLAWAKEQEDLWIAEYAEKAEAAKAKVANLRIQLDELRTNRQTIMQPFYKAQQEYFNYIYKRDKDMWYVLDPVITVHPDEVFFECFSQDESSYGKLGCNYNVFQQISEYECGTTNIDYSNALYNEFQKIRDYKATEFKIDPSGFEVATEGEDTYKEVKIDLPESWVKGFLQVSSAMTLPSATFDLHPIDLYNFLFMLKRYKAKIGPRSIRFKLNPGKPIEVVFEPWNYVVKCPRSIYKGDTPREIRTWGRRRLLTLERLIPISKSIKVTLLGDGLPSFYVADLGDMNFTLGLSGWTANDWSNKSKFDLLQPSLQVENTTIESVWKALKKVWLATAADLAKATSLSESVVLGALQVLVQGGKVIYDLNSQVYRRRELSKEALDIRALRFNSEQEAIASDLLVAKKVEVQQKLQAHHGHLIMGKVFTDYKPKEVTLHLDDNQKIIKANCTCDFFKQHKLSKPCEHILAIKALSVGS